MGDFMSKDDEDALREQYGLNQGLHIQYMKWIWGVIHWDLGISLEFQMPVTQLLNERLLMTIVLISFTIVFTWSLAVPIGII